MTPVSFFLGYLQYVWQFKRLLGEETVHTLLSLVISAIFSLVTILLFPVESKKQLQNNAKPPISFLFIIGTI